MITTKEVNNITVEDARKLISKGDELLILDTSLEEDYKEAHVKNSISIPYKKIREAIPELEQYKDKNILVYCKTGRGSAVAVTVLVCKGFKNIYHMYEGFSVYKEAED